MTEAVTYPGTPPARLVAANDRKRKFQDLFAALGGRYAMGNGSKPYLGELSPGCLTCMRGTWSCVFLNALCTRNCFFCPQDRQVSEEPPSRTEDGFQFDGARDYVAHLAHFPVEGIGISGGEPFLAFEKLLEHVRVIRETFGAAPYVWSYTNGDLATDERLALLQQAGLDELRVNISANAYDLSAVERAVRRIPTVTVEIPAIPEDLAGVKALLPRLEALGVKHVNVHQLLMNEHNHLALKQRGYTVTHAERHLHGLPVPDSELAALDLLLHAARTKSALGVNYCSRCYKARFQERAFRRRHARMFGVPDQTITEAGYLRRVFLEVPEAGLPPFLDLARKRGLPDPAVSPCAAGVRLELPAEALREAMRIDPRQAVGVAYEAPVLRPRDPSSADRSGTKEFAGNQVALGSELVQESRLENPASVVFFQKLFIEGLSPVETARAAAGYFAADEQRLPEILEDVEAFQRQFEGLERTPVDLPDYD